MTDSDRGTLDIRDHAVVRIAEIAASRVTGVERIAGGLTSRTMPRAEASVRNGRVRATIDVATLWPTPIADVAHRVRRAVVDDIAHSSGLDIESVDVRMHYTPPERTPGTQESRVNRKTAPVPKAAPKASGVALVLALLLCGVAVILGRDALIDLGAVNGASWIGPAIDSVLSVTVQSWMLPAGAAVGVLGIVLLLLALVPRLRTHRPSGTEGVWIKRGARRRVSSLGTAAAAADRVVTALTGLVLIALGAAAAAWQQDRLPTWASEARATVEAWQPGDWDSAGWWPWALLAVAVVLLVLGLRWLYAHRPRRQPSRTATLDDEHASVDLTSAARNAAAEFESMPGIGSATARVMGNPSTPVVRISGITDDPAPSTDAVVEKAERLRIRCASALDGLPVEVQVLVDVRSAK